jgi:hypothetical protein
LNVSEKIEAPEHHIFKYPKMNLFVLDYNPKKAAEAHGDKHVVKMILEACQMLYTAHWTTAYPHLLNERSAVKIAKAHKVLPIPAQMASAPKRKCADEQGFRPVHLHHPCTIWIRECTGNYMWAVELALAIAEEYEYRWPGRVHSCKAHALWLKANVPNIPKAELETFSVAMDDIYRVHGDPKASYIKYYRGSKQDRNLTVYTRREKPGFLKKRV